jgi:hypothetical protein
MRGLDLHTYCGPMTLVTIKKSCMTSPYSVIVSCYGVMVQTTSTQLLDQRFKSRGITPSSTRYRWTTVCPLTKNLQGPPRRNSLAREGRLGLNRGAQLVSELYYLGSYEHVTGPWRLIILIDPDALSAMRDDPHANAASNPGAYAKATGFGAEVATRMAVTCASL